jgi:[protein-PII] uridylyltransferase
VSAVDVFYVKDQFGLKIDKEARLQQIREGLMTALAEGEGAQTAAVP